VRAAFGRLAVPLKSAFLFVVFAKFHATWIGATVVLCVGLLLFGADRAVRRWAGRLLAGLR
jgi:hypothetical protein